MILSNFLGGEAYENKDCALEEEKIFHSQIVSCMLKEEHFSFNSSVLSPSTEEKTPWIKSLPLEIVHYIISFLKVSDMKVCREVCREENWQYLLCYSLRPFLKRKRFLFDFREGNNKKAVQDRLANFLKSSKYFLPYIYLYIYGNPTDLIEIVEKKDFFKIENLRISLFFCTAEKEEDFDGKISRLFSKLAGSNVKTLSLLQNEVGCIKPEFHEGFRYLESLNLPLKKLSISRIQCNIGPEEMKCIANFSCLEKLKLGGKLEEGISLH
jgi:hypothetical protein